MVSRTKMSFAVIVCLALTMSACSTQMGTGVANKTNQPTQAEASAGDTSSVAQENPNQIEAGDFVSVDYNLRLKTGELVLTSSKKVANDPNENRVDWYIVPETYGPEEIIAGKESKAPMLADTVIGMTALQKKSVPVQPESGFGTVNEKFFKSYRTQKKIPYKTVVSAQEFVVQFNSFPEIGQKVNLTPYFPSEVVAVDKRTVTLEARVESGTTVDADFGKTRIDIVGEDIVMTLDPEVGAPFTVRGKKGVISQKDGDRFTVDYNHPGAGKTLSLEVDVLSFQKASAFDTKELVWIKDHDDGYDMATEQEKPMVLLLYASWCSWSKRFLDETVQDPRIQKYWDDFVWVKVDSDKEKGYHELYEQDGYPMVVLIDDHGEIIKKLDGFKDARTLKKELAQCLEMEMKG